MTTADLKKKLTAVESDIHSHEREIYNLEAKKREIEYQLAMMQDIDVVKT
jgi:hypothetical protein